MSTVDLKERRKRGRGRREQDSNECVFNEKINTQSLNCLIAISDRIKSLEHSMNGTVTIKIAAIITSIAMGFLICFIGLAFAVLDGIKDDIKSMSSAVVALDKRMDNIQISQTRLATQQAYVIKSMDDLKKEQGEIYKEN